VLIDVNNNNQPRLYIKHTGLVGTFWSYVRQVITMVPLSMYDFFFELLELIMNTKFNIN